jgi:excisionase family DNA binding protein
MHNDFLFLQEVADELRTSLSTVRYWIATGKLPSVRPGRHRLVRRRDLDAFVEATATPRREQLPADDRQLAFPWMAPGV